MLNDDVKDQIPLFDIPAPSPKTTAAPTAPKNAPPRQQKGSAPVPSAGTKPASGGTSAAKRAARPAGQAQSTARSRPAPRNKTAAPKVSGAVPDGDVRLTANIRQDLHLRLKIEAAHRRTTIGELIEEYIEQYL